MANAIENYLKKMNSLIRNKVIHFHLKIISSIILILNIYIYIHKTIYTKYTLHQNLKRNYFNHFNGSASEIKIQTKIKAYYQNYR